MDKIIIPKPTVMPIDRKQWANELHISNFINAYAQFNDIQKCGNVNKILIVGPGQGFDTQVLRWRKYDVTTFDIDETFNPDCIGSVHDLSMFTDKSFDVIIVSHVLEHLAVPFFDLCLAELARVGKYTIIYLPVAGRHFQIRFKFDVKGIDFSIFFDLYNYFHKPDGITPMYCGGQHFWELGMKGYRKSDIIKRFKYYYDIVNYYRNSNWNASYNFVLRSKD